MDSNKSREIGYAVAARAAWCVAAATAGVLIGCASGGGASSAPAAASAPATTAQPSVTVTSTATTTVGANNAPQPARATMAGDVERTTFAPSLGIDLGAMIRRTSGLYVQDLETGTGSVAATGRTAVLKYAGWLPSGKLFDSGEITITLGTNKVIRAWEDGVLGMRVGGRRRLVAPPHLGYGSKGAGNDIPPNSVLVFEMQLTTVY